MDLSLKTQRCLSRKKKITIFLLKIDDESIINKQLWDYLDSWFKTKSQINDLGVTKWVSLNSKKQMRWRKCSLASGSGLQLWLKISRRALMTSHFEEEEEEEGWFSLWTTRRPPGYTLMHLFFFFFFLLLTEHYSVPSRELLAAGTPSTSVTARKHCRETLTTEQISSRNKQDFAAEETFITWGWVL